MKKFLTLFMALALAAGCYAQRSSWSASSINDKPIVVGGNLLNRTYSVGDRNIIEEELRVILLSVPDSKKAVRWATTLDYTSFAITFAGWYLVGYGVTDAIFHSDEQLYKKEMAWGAVIAAVGYGVSAWSQTRYMKAVKLYNAQLGGAAAGDDLSLNIGLTSSGGVGVQLNF